MKMIEAIVSSSDTFQLNKYERKRNKTFNTVPSWGAISYVTLPVAKRQNILNVHYLCVFFIWRCALVRSASWESDVPYRRCITREHLSTLNSCDRIDPLFYLRFFSSVSLHISSCLSLRSLQKNSEVLFVRSCLHGIIIFLLRLYTLSYQCPNSSMGFNSRPFVTIASSVAEVFLSYSTVLYWIMV